jgi:hypothetical protein
MVALKPLLDTVTSSVPIVDTSNYYSIRDGHIEADGQACAHALAQSHRLFDTDPARP